MRGKVDLWSVKLGPGCLLRDKYLQSLLACFRAEATGTTSQAIMQMRLGASGAMLPCCPFHAARVNRATTCRDISETVTSWRDTSDVAVSGADTLRYSASLLSHRYISKWTWRNVAQPGRNSDEGDCGTPITRKRHSQCNGPRDQIQPGTPIPIPISTAGYRVSDQAGIGPAAPPQS